jgi:hypothetical protein
MGPATQGVSLSGVVPLHVSVLEHIPVVLDWIRSWTGVLKLEVLYPEGWHTNGHKQATFLWAPLRLRRMRRLGNCARRCTSVHNALMFLLRLF